MKVPSTPLIVIGALIALVTSAAAIAAPRRADTQPVAYLPMITKIEAPVITEIRLELVQGQFMGVDTHCPKPIGGAQLHLDVRLDSKTATSASITVHVDGQDWKYKPIADGVGLLLQTCFQGSADIRWATMRVPSDGSPPYLLVLDPTLLVLPSPAELDGTEWVAPEIAE